MDRGALLQAAVADNIAWCGAVCSAHGSKEIESEHAWANLAPSPRYYPNVITRRPHAQAGITALIDRLQLPKPWSIKDSFHDLDLHYLGFAPVIEAQWFGGYSTMEGDTHNSWSRVSTLEQLARWTAAWDEGADSSPFKPALLSDKRIGFWQLLRNGAIAAGGISFASGPVIGLSNWFAADEKTVFALGLTDAIAKVYPGLPIVFWTADEQAGLEGFGLRCLGDIRVWTTTTTP